MPSLEQLAFLAEREMARMDAFFPLLPRLGNRWAAARPWEGLTIGLNLHVTTITGSLLREMILGGGTWVVSAANMATTDPGTVASLRNMGIEVYTGGDLRDRHMQVLSHEPDLIVDVGFDLCSTALDKRPELASRIHAAIEITRSGVNRLRRERDLPYPVININDGQLQNAIENGHGVGSAVWQSVTNLTGMHLSGRRAVVIGYGPVGRGLATYGRSVGLSVEIVETDPVRRLFAHYDGFPTADLQEALSRVEVVVTATGTSRVLRSTMFAELRDGTILLNAGHGDDEIAVEDLRRVAEQAEQVSNQVVRYQLSDGRRITVLGGGNPLNIVLNAGSPEPILLHFAALGLVLEWAAHSDLPPGETLIPTDIERQVAELALQALQLGRS